MKQTFTSARRPLEILIHIISWGIMFGFPFFFVERGNGNINWMAYIRHLAVPLSFMIAFYVNYFILVPRYLFQSQAKRYIVYNIIFLCVIGILLHLWQSLTFDPSFAPKAKRPGMPPGWLFFLRDMLSLVFTIGLSAAIRMSARWTQNEAARKEAERNRAEAELKNLRNQLNPHFLLNTLNNIYALIAFDSDKAQQAVQELSKLLRYVLYDNQQTYVPLCKEVDFIRNYIELMRIRLTFDPSFAPKAKRPGMPPGWLFFLRDMLSLVFTIGLSAAIRMSARWTQNEAARKEAERNRAEAELKNLRNQLNPHFLLNTLNNIYALIAFDSDKAQQAVQELSKLLRYVLYDNQQTYVPLCKEVDFIRNYIELMRIRLSANVQMITKFDIQPDSQTLIAPLIFISLIENAFKHGISPTESSFISIHLSENDKEVICEIRNSNHPKTVEDKSGSGVGLEQVSRRLEILYPGAYTWSKGISKDEKVYESKLSIKIRE